MSACVPVLVVERVHLEVCVACDNVAIPMAWTPATVVGRRGAYRIEPAGSLCLECSLEGERRPYPSRAAYELERQRRAALIRRSCDLGYPCRTSEVGS